MGHEFELDGPIERVNNVYVKSGMADTVCTKAGMYTCRKAAHGRVQYLNVERWRQSGRSNRCQFLDVRMRR